MKLRTPGGPGPRRAAGDNWTDRIEAIVFDLDGVLVDSEIWWDQVRIEFAASVGRVWTAADREAVMGSNTRQWGERMRRLLQIELAEEEIQRAVIEGMLERYKRLGPPEIEGAAEAVRQLAARYPVAVASSAPRILIEAALDGLGVRSLFGTVVSSDEVEAGKPHPDVYLRAAQGLGTRPEACRVVEDSINGLESARAAGMFAVLVPNASIPPPREAHATADLVLARLADLSELLAVGARYRG